MFALRRVKSFDKLRDVFKRRKKRSDQCEEEGNINEMVSIDDESPITFTDEMRSSDICSPPPFVDKNGRINKLFRSFRKKMRGSKRRGDKICSMDTEKCTTLIDEFEHFSDDESRDVFSTVDVHSALHSSCNDNNDVVNNYMIASLPEDSNDGHKSPHSELCLKTSHNVYETPLTFDRFVPSVNASLTQELAKLAKYGWYWGPISRSEAEEKLSGHADGAFLVRDSSDDHYLLSLSFRSYGRTFHTRIEHANGSFSFYSQPEPEAYPSVVMLIEESIKRSHEGVFCYSRGRSPGSPSFPVRLTKPVSRFTQVRSLQYLCRFLIRQYTRFDHIQKLPLPPRIKGYLEEGHY